MPYLSATSDQCLSENARCQVASTNNPPLSRGQQSPPPAHGFCPLTVKQLWGQSFLVTQSSSANVSTFLTRALPFFSISYRNLSTRRRQKIKKCLSLKSVSSSQCLTSRRVYCIFQDRKKLYFIPGIIFRVNPVLRNSCLYLLQYLSVITDAQPR